MTGVVRGSRSPTEYTGLYPQIRPSCSGAVLLALVDLAGRVAAHDNQQTARGVDDRGVGELDSGGRSRV